MTTFAVTNVEERADGSPRTFATVTLQVAGPAYDSTGNYIGGASFAQTDGAGAVSFAGLTVGVAYAWTHPNGDRTYFTAASTGTFALNAIATGPPGAGPGAVTPDTLAAAVTAALSPLSSVYVPLASKGVASGVATLDGSGKMPSGQLPVLTFATPTPVTSQAAMLALSATVGTLAIRTDVSPPTTFILTATPPSTLANWTQIALGVVSSVAGKVGSVTLGPSDVSAVPLTAITTATRLNRATAPIPTSSGGWLTHSAIYGTATLDTSVVARAGTTSSRLTRTATSPSQFIAQWDRVGQPVSTVGVVPVTAGESFPVSVMMKCDVACLGQMIVTFYNAGSTVVSGPLNLPLVSVPAATWTQVTGGTLTVPATAVTMYVQVLNKTTDGSNAPTGTNTWIQDAQFGDGTYFDGSLAAVGNETYTWTGTANASTSQAKSPQVASTVQGKTGTVVLAPADVGADPAGAAYAIAERLNRATAPIPTASGGWLSNNAIYGTATLDTSVVARVGSTSSRLTRTATSPSQFIGQWDRVGQPVTTLGVIPVTPLESFYASVMMRCDIACQGQLIVTYLNAALATVSGPLSLQLTTVPAATWAPVPAPINVPAGAVWMYVQVLARTTDGSNAPTGTNIWIQDAMFGNGTYFDGTTAASGDESYTWTGATNASTSRATRTTRSAQYQKYMPTSLQTSAEQALRDEVRLAKGGRIGISGKGAVALRFDHWLNALFGTVWPLLVARSLPGGVCLYSGMLSGPYADSGSNSYTWSDVSSRSVSNGLEVWSHSYSHADTPQINGMAGLTREIVTSKSDLIGSMPLVKVQGWMQPGVSPAAGNTYPYLALDAPLKVGFNAVDHSAWYNSDAGRMLRQTYPLIEGDGFALVRQLPTGPLVGAGHYTVDTSSLPTLKALVDFAGASQTGVEIMCHAGQLGLAGNLSVADYTAFLDYIVAARDAGLIDVVTPSGLYFADPGSTIRARLVYGGSFAGFNPAAPAPWSAVTGVTAGTDTGVNYVQIAAGGSMLQDYTTLQYSMFDGEAFEVLCQVRRAVSATAATAQVTLTDPLGTWSQTYTLAIPSGTTWTTWRIPFCVPVGAKTARTAISQSSGGSVQFSNFTVQKI